MERQTTIYDLIGETATKRKGIIKERVITEEVKTSDLAERPLFGVLMSAHWCPPCKGFLPHLKKFCDEVNALDIHKRDDRVKGFRLKG
jgi:thiol-disulfide isomerase/thioredoxin